jgi:hypothetical protein
MRYLYFFIAFSLVSCAHKINPISPKNTIIDSRKLNTNYTEDIGRSLYEKGYYNKYNAIKIIDITPNFRINYEPFPYAVGDVVPLFGNDKSYYYYYDSSKADTHPMGIIRSKKYHNYLAFANSPVSGLYIKEVPTLVVERTTYIPEYCDKCFKQEIVYTGKSGSTANFLYREYSSNLIRADFNQELQYDLNESNIIGFKGMRIEIVETTNTNITYRVLSRMD